MNDLSHVKSLIIVFAMPDCVHCHEYLPRLTKQVNHFRTHGVPVFFYANGAVPPGQIPVLVYDGTSQDADVQALADRFKVEGMPTTILLTHNAQPATRVGALDDDEIYQLLSSAAIANR